MTPEELDAAAEALFLKNSKGWTRLDWAELHDDTKQLWRDEVVKRLPRTGDEQR